MPKTISKKKSNTLKLKFDTWQYAPAPESKSAATIKPQYDLFINGEWIKPSANKYFDSINPATEEKLSAVAEANVVDVDKAVSSARKALPAVSKNGTFRFLSLSDWLGVTWWVTRMPRGFVCLN